MQFPFLKSLLIAAMGLFFSHQSHAAPQSIKSFYASSKQIDRLKKIPSDLEILDWEARVVTLINQVRIKYNLPTLGMQKDLLKLAKEHSWNMALGKCSFGHDGFQDRARKTFKLGPYNGIGENVAYTYLVEDPLLVSLEGWMKSPGHRENILGDFHETGVGIAFSPEGRCYITQLFAKFKG